MKVQLESMNVVKQHQPPPGSSFHWLLSYSLQWYHSNQLKLHLQQFTISKFQLVVFTSSFKDMSLNSLVFTQDLSDYELLEHYGETCMKLGMEIDRRSETVKLSNKLGKRESYPSTQV